MTEKKETRGVSTRSPQMTLSPFHEMERMERISTNSSNGHSPPC